MNDLDRSLAIGHADYIEAKGGRWPRLTRHPIPRRTSHFSLFFPVHGTERAAIAGGNSSLHLDERNDASLSAHALDDEIDVTMATSKSPLYNAPALSDQPLLCDPLAS